MERKKSQRINEVVENFIEKNPSFDRLEAFRMNFCIKCGTEFDEENKKNMFGYFEVVTGANGERVVPSVSCCGE